uniref:Uncharacterized protein n=1 Tax=Oncorhynchus mykiss TaxID=8022 RepID=A0A8K9V699_ONCMY
MNYHGNQIISLWISEHSRIRNGPFIAPEDKEDIFARRAHPAFLVFDNAAYLADMTIELPCHCKPEEIHSVVRYYQIQLGSPDTRALTDFQGTSVVDSSKVVRGGHLRSRFSIRLFSLLIFRAQKENSGHCLCGRTNGGLLLYTGESSRGGTPLILSCPGAKPQHVVGLNETSRLFIDTGHHLHCSPATQEDRGSCWIQGKRAAEIRLGVYYHLGCKRLLSESLMP